MGAVQKQVLDSLQLPLLLQNSEIAVPSAIVTQQQLAFPR
jgi:hypothetical protein